MALTKPESIATTADSGRVRGKNHSRRPAAGFMELMNSLGDEVSLREGGLLAVSQSKLGIPTQLHGKVSDLKGSAKSLVAGDDVQLDSKNLPSADFTEGMAATKVINEAKGSVDDPVGSSSLPPDVAQGFGAQASAASVVTLTQDRQLAGARKLDGDAKRPATDTSIASSVLASSGDANESRAPEVRDSVKVASRLVDASSSGVDEPRVESQVAFSDVMSSALRGGLNSSERAVAAPSAGLHIDVPMTNQEAWNQALNQRVLFMMRDGVSEASLSISPESLGPVDVKVKMDAGNVDVEFSSPYQEVREAISKGVDALGASMSEGGMHLAKVEVKDPVDSMFQDKGRDSQHQSKGNSGDSQQKKQGQNQQFAFLEKESGEA